MTSRISELDRPYRFVDEQTAGPFRTFHHEHRFRAVGDETEMTDVVTLASPVFGAAAERTVLVPYLRRLIVARNRHLVGSVRTRSPA
jgi:ligand-binding SRPBCC domain-containing protein